MVAAELEYGAITILDGSQPQRGEAQRGRPALGPLEQDPDLLLIQLEACAIDEQLVRLGRRERQVPRANLGQRPAPAEARELECRIGPGDHDQSCARRHPLDRVFERRQAVRIRDRVQVVEDERERPTVFRDSVHDLVDRYVDRHPGRPQPMQRAPAEAVANPIRRRGHVGPQPRGLVIARVERHPGQRASATLGPVAQRRGLPVSGGGGHEGQRAVCAGLEGMLETRPADHPGTQSRCRQLRLRKRRQLVGQTQSD